jgi:uncharacterized transporter YbjL
MKVKFIQQTCDVLTIFCPALIAVVGTLEGSGIIQALGDKGVWVASGLGVVTTAASIVFNIVTGYYKKQ